METLGANYGDGMVGGAASAAGQSSASRTQGLDTTSGFYTADLLRQLEQLMAAEEKETISK